MGSENFGAKHRLITDQQLTKTLLMGLGGSALLHTVAITGVSYLAHSNINEQMDIVEIERVEVDPEPAPSTKPIAPAVKPIPIPEPRVFKPKIAVSIPTPIAVKIPTPEPTPDPEQVVKITKSAAQLQTAPLANLVSPAATPIKTATVVMPKSNPLRAFPDKLFSNPQPQPARTEVPTRKIDNSSPQKFPIKDSQPTTATTNQTALATNNKPPKLVPNPSLDRDHSPATDEELIPSTPGSTSKLARIADQSIPTNNQTSLANSSKSPTGFGSNFGSIDSNTPTANDDFAGIPGNNTRIANNNQTTAPTSSNQTGLGSKQTKPSGLNTGFANSSGGDDRLNGSDEIVGGTPGNNSRVARSNSGGNQRGNGNGNNNQTGGGTNNGTPGNIATASRNQLSIQCLRNCEIRYPDELENSDVGKDKILVKVTIDANGLVASAEISRSSGNQKLDQFTLDGVKQMQLNATGKTRTHKIRISTLMNN